MKPKNQKTKRISSLRKQAERILNEQEEMVDSLSNLGVKRLAHELATHQFELEIQNEELRDAQIVIEASRRRFAELFDFAPVGYFSLDAKGVILEANVTVADMLGIGKKLLIKKPFHVFIEDKNDRTRFQNYFTTVLKGGVKSTCELMLRGGRAEPFYARLESIPFEDGTDGTILMRTVVSDITELKRAEEKVEKLLERYRSYIEVTGQVGWTTNAEGEVIEDTPSWRAYTGQTYDEVKGWGWARALHPDDVKHTARLWRKAVTEKHMYEAEYRIRRHDGLYRDFIARGMPVFGEDGSVREWTGTCIDITERKQVEREKEKALAELERSNKDLEQFANVISHDLRAPLRTITGFVHILADDYRSKLDAKADDYMDRIVAGSERMQRMIDDLLAYSRVGVQSTELSTVNAESVLTQAMENLHALIEERKAVITRDPLPTIRADQSQMVMLFQNLIGNAVKYSLRSPRIHVSAASVGREMTLSVRDNGIGIPSEHKDRIWGLFQRLHTEREYPGTGTGLAICKKIVERHGGRIWVKSKKGEGSTFFFTIPGENPAAGFD